MSFLKKDDLQRLAQIVREVTGNQVQEKNYSMLESRLRAHSLKLGIASASEYWKHYSENESAEREAIQSLMTTHYTFFFREYAHFEILDNWISTEHKRLKSRFEATKKPVQIWSAACSRGQEVYSLAMFLEVNLFKKYNIPFEILGTDIDAESVAFAKNGVYPLKEVNTIPQMYLSEYWRKGTGPIKDFAAVHPSLKAKTKFHPLNLLELKKWSDKTAFDVIFCRNVFIYFSEAHVQQIALDLAARLSDGALMVSGMSEPLRFKEWTMKSIGPSCYLNSKGEATPVQKIQIHPTSAQPAAAARPLPSYSLSPELQKQNQKTAGPKAIAAHSIAPVHTYEETANFVSDKRYRVLCVDDSVTIQLLMKKIFSQDPLCEKVDIAVNGRDAREKLNQAKYNVITLDIHMPEVNGIEFLEKLYNRKSDPPVIMVSSVNRTDLDLATKSLSLGAFDYVEKPAMNNLQKSADEILTKARMAIRSSHVEVVSTNTSFDVSIGQKIVIPDASQTLRIAMAAPANIKSLEFIVKGQRGEYRSPALIVVWRDPSNAINLESELLKWSDRQIVSLRTSTQLLKPNHVYILKSEVVSEVLAKVKAKTASLQILDANAPDFRMLNSIPSMQVLIDENIAPHRLQIEKQCGVRVSDVTPATSFPSLSVEFFANLRKAVA